LNGLITVLVVVEPFNSIIIKNTLINLLLIDGFELINVESFHIKDLVGILHNLQSTNWEYVYFPKVSVGVAFDLYPSFGIIIQFMTVLSLLGCKFNNLYIIDLLNSMVEFCNECEINSDEEDFIDTTFEDILIKNTEEDIFNKIQKKVLMKKSDAELKLYLTRVINWNTYEDLTTMALCVEAKAHLNSKFVWLVRMREHFTHLIKRFKKACY
jgi:hypothetical protein